MQIIHIGRVPRVLGPTKNEFCVLNTALLAFSQWFSFSGLEIKERH